MADLAIPPQGNDSVVYPWSRKPASTDEALEALYGMTGIPDLKGSIASFQRGEPLAGLGQGAAGLSQMVPMLKPEMVGLAGIFAGAKAFNYAGSYHRIRDLMLAKAYRGAFGYGERETFDLTGWFQGVDGKWRHIISDEDAKLGSKVETSKLEAGAPDWKKEDFASYGPDYSVAKPLVGSNMNIVYPKLSEVLDHPELYKAYPDLENVEVRPVPPLIALGGTRGGMNADGTILYMGGQKKEDFMSTLLHEVQHLVQQREGFARGGSTNEFLADNFSEMRNANHREWADEIEPALSDAGINPYKAEHHMRTYIIGNQPIADWQTSAKAVQGQLENLDPDLKGKLIDNIRQKNMLDSMENEAFRRYEALGGEVEARTVQEQFSQRDWSRLPSEMEGFPAPGDQIIKFDRPGTKSKLEGVMPKLEPVEHDPFQP